MAAVVFLVGAAFFGIGLVRLALSWRLTRAEQGLWGLVIGWTLTTAAAYLVARFNGRLTSGVIWVITAGAWLGAAGLWWRQLPAWRRNEGAKPCSRRDELVLIALFCSFAFIYIPLFDSHMLKAGPDGGLYSGGGSTIYDVPFHSALSTAF